MARKKTNPFEMETDKAVEAAPETVEAAPETVEAAPETVDPLEKIPEVAAAAAAADDDIRKDDPHGRWVYVEAFDSFVTKFGVYPVSDIDNMMAVINGERIREIVGDYAKYLRDTAKEKLSRPAKKGGYVIEKGRFKGRTAKSKPAYTPDAKQIDRFINTEVTHAREFLSWYLK